MRRVLPLAPGLSAAGISTAAAWVVLGVFFEELV
jgi:hypothetical protein